MRLGLRFVSPVIGLGVHGNRQRCRHLDEDRSITSAVFKQKHTRAAVFGQAIGEHAARRAGPDDNVIESLAIHSRDACPTHRFSPDYASAPSDATQFFRWSPNTKIAPVADRKSRTSDATLLRRPLTAIEISRNERHSHEV